MYARHIPIAVFSLALVVEGVSIIGVIYDPFTDNMYSAIKGKGTYQNNKRIKVNKFNLEDIKTMGHCDMSSRKDYNISNVFEKLREKTRLNDIGSIARACSCVATGDYSFAIFTGTNHKNCDIAASKVIVEKSGGKVTNLFGKYQRYDQSIKGAIISNGIVHDEIVKIINQYLDI